VWRRSAQRRFSISEGALLERQPFQQYLLVCQGVLDLAPRGEHDGTIVSHRLRLPRGGDFDLRAQRPAFVDWDGHANPDRREPRVEAQQREQLIAQASADNGD
jgi:hypothetical protein